MKTRYFVIAAVVALFVLAVYLIFATLPDKNSAVPIAPPTVDPGEKLSGDNLDGQLLFTRGGNLWAWRGNSAQRMAIEPGSSVIAKGKVILTQPVISPRGNAIAYIRQDESFSDLWVVNSDGSNPRNLTNNKPQGQPRTGKFVENTSWAFDPTWSPDGNLLAFISDKGTDDAVLWLWSSKTSNFTRVPLSGLGSGGVGRPSWSPDSTRVAVAAYLNGKSQIFRVNLQNNQFIKLTEQPDGAYDPAYSPDGQSIAFVSRKGNVSELWLMDSDGENPLLLSTIVSRSPVWSPDGTKIAFLGLKDASFDIYTIEVQSGKPGALKQYTKNANLDGTGGLNWGK